MKERKKEERERERNKAKKEEKMINRVKEIRPRRNFGLEIRKRTRE